MKMFPEKVTYFFKIDYHASFQYTEVCGASVAVDSTNFYIPHFFMIDGRKLKKWSVLSAFQWPNIPTEVCENGQPIQRFGMHVHAFTHIATHKN
jgi:hypothetical protein